MAKETVSPIERHLEKGVLALTVLLFVAVVVKYLITSPNTMQVNTRAVGPAEIYQAVENEAKVLRENVRNAQTKVAKAELRQPAGPELPVAALANPVPFGPRVPRLETEQTGNIELVSVVAPGAPVVVTGRSGMALVPSRPVTAMPKDVYKELYPDWNAIDNQRQGYVVAVNWATIAATVDLGEQAQRAREKKYAPGRAIPYVVGTELERRERNWDGTYSPWAPVKTYAPFVLPELPVVELEETEGELAVAEDSRHKLQVFSGNIQNPDLRLELMRPMPAPVAYGDWWLRTKLSFPNLDLLRLDDEVWWGNEVSYIPLFDRYPKERKERPKNPEQQDWNKIVEEELAKLDTWFSQSCYGAVKSRGEELQKTSGPYFNEKQKERLMKLVDKATQGKALQDKEAEERKKKGLPPPTREVSPIQILWAHDALEDSVISGKTYQYRMRALLYNNYAGATRELKNPHDAELVVLPGEWSEASADITIPYDTEFWMVSKKDREQMAKLEVFKWHEGAWVKAAFEVGVGNVIGGKALVKQAEGKTSNTVDFTTGATVVDLDFNYPYRARTEKKGSLVWEEPKPTLAMFYLDATGELRQRVLEVDKKDPKHREMNDKLEKRPAPPANP
jgi:hypothetical protein